VCVVGCRASGTLEFRDTAEGRRRRGRDAENTECEISGGISLKGESGRPVRPRMGGWAREKVDANSTVVVRGIPGDTADDAAS